MHTISVSAIGGLFVVLATCAGVAQNAPVAGDNMGELDCVIEPKLVLKLGTPETGIIEAVNVDRDHTVKKGDVVARLDSDLQRIALDLAQSKAANQHDINSEKTRVNFRTI